jgi:hypothetical protein
MEFLKKFTYRKWWVYCIRWLTSGLVIAPITSLALLAGLPVWVGVSLGNFAGAALYWHFDLWLICDKPSKYRVLNWIKEKLK